MYVASVWTVPLLHKVSKICVCSSQSRKQGVRDATSNLMPRKDVNLLTYSNPVQFPGKEMKSKDFSVKSHVGFPSGTHLHNLM